VERRRLPARSVQDQQQTLLVQVEVDAPTMMWSIPEIEGVSDGRNDETGSRDGTREVKATPSAKSASIPSHLHSKTCFADATHPMRVSRLYSGRRSKVHTLVVSHSRPNQGMSGRGRVREEVISLCGVRSGGAEASVYPMEIQAGSSATLKQRSHCWAGGLPASFVAPP